MKAKMRNAGFSFHHEISTDGVAVSLLYSKVNHVHGYNHDAHRPNKIMRTYRPPVERDMDEGEVVAPEDGGSTSGKRVGLDPGKRRIFTMVCEETNC